MNSSRHLPICAALLLMTLAVFGQVLGFGFIDYDDHFYVYENHHVRQGLEPDSIAWAFTSVEGGSWQPLTWLSLMLDAEFGGGPRAFHRTNLILHVVNVLLLHFVLFAMTGHRWRSGFAAALFALHPLQVENVAWISERKDLLCALFCFLALGAYVRYARGTRRAWYAALTACFVLALMSKQVLVTLPLLLLLLDYWPLKRVAGLDGDGAAQAPKSETTQSAPKRAAGAAAAPSKPPFSRQPWTWLIVEKMPLLFVAAGFGVLALLTQTGAGSVEPLEKYSLATRLFNAVVAYAVYLRRTVWPLDLAVFYPHPGDTIAPTEAAAALLVLLAISTVAISLWRRRPAVLVGWLWFFVSLFPVIGLVQVGKQQMSDRYTYVPLIGLFVAAAWALSSKQLTPGSRRRAVAGLAAVILLGCAVLSWRQAARWQNSVTLFEHTLQVTDDNVLAHMNLATALEKRQRHFEQVEEYHKALAIEPENPYVHHNLGRALHRLGRSQEALGHLRAALRLKPDYALGHYTCGIVLLSLDRVDEAIEHLQATAQLNPDYAPARYDLGNAFSARGNWNQAIEQLSRAVDLKPNYAQARHNLALALAQTGRFDEAVSHYRQALQSGLQFPMAHFNLALALEKLGRVDEAMAALQAAISKGAANAHVHNKLGELLLEHFDNREVATRHFHQALRLDPNFAQAKKNLQRAETD